MPDSLFLMHFFHGLTYFDEILQEADGVILSRGNLGIDLPPEKNLRPPRAEATDVANAILDGNFQFEKLPAVTFVAWSNAILLGSDTIFLGVETLRGLYQVDTISTVGSICAEPYMEVVSSYSSGKVSELKTYIQTTTEKFESDNNLGLVKQVISSMYKRNIQRLTQTYWTLSLQDIAKNVQLSSPKEAEIHVLQMVVSYAIILDAKLTAVS
ncbi:hypothetical protein POTOM_039625 [Populus tomentosa]|uniref:PCI domain-containing protein n=1 Tax=Populus tomentosa TaxID=118781 RepID=A0A8X8CJ83_POPTO|nr:hypothetical protein POTOM_039625 [Populus tomentosa]